MVISLIIVGPGRAGMSLGLAAVRAGHSVAGVLSRSGATDPAEQLGAAALTWGDPMPRADLIVVAVPDDAIVDVAQGLGPQDVPAVHLSGLTTSAALSAMGPVVGSLHPLQTLPNPEAGAAALAGSFMAVTCDDEGLRRLLFDFVASLGATPFDLAEEAKALYHAGASAVSNFVTTSLALGEQAFEAAGVPFRVAEPLVRAAVARSFELGARAALTGPIARGDVGTVRAQRAALGALSGDLEQAFVELASATARLAGTASQMKEVLDGGR